MFMSVCVCISALNHACIVPYVWARVDQLHSLLAMTEIIELVSKQREKNKKNAAMEERSRCVCVLADCDILCKS